MLFGRDFDCSEPFLEGLTARFDRAPSEPPDDRENAEERIKAWAPAPDLPTVSGFGCGDRVARLGRDFVAMMQTAKAGKSNDLGGCWHVQRIWSHDGRLLC